MHSPNIKPTTADQYRRTIERHIVPQLGHLPVQQLTARRIQQHYAALLGAGVGPRTVRFVHERLKQALDHARKLRMVARNEAEDATPPTMPKREMRIWDDEQIARFLDVADQSIYGPLWVLALYTGLRRGELCGLRWGDIEWEGGILHVRQSITVIGGREVVQTPKSGRQRTVSVPESLLEALKAHRTRQRAQRLRMGPVWHENDLVFTVGHGGPLHPDNIDLDFKRLIALAEVPIIRIHDLRHTHASLLLRHGEQLTVVSQRLGHTRTSVTSDVYAHVLPDQHRETAERLGRLLARKV
jgi:integrase